MIWMNRAEVLELPGSFFCTKNQTENRLISVVDTSIFTECGTGVLSSRMSCAAAVCPMMIGGERRIDNASFGDIVEACDGNVFGDFVAAKFQSFNRSDGNEIIVRKVRAGERSSAVYDFQHVGECALNRWREFVNDGFCSGHPVFAHRPVKTVCPFAKVSDSVGRAEMPRLAAAAVDEIAGGQVGSLCVVDEYAAAVSRIEIGIQKNYRN